MPLFSVMMSAGDKKVLLYVGKGGKTEEIFNEEQRKDFVKENGIGCHLEVIASDPVASKTDIVLSNNEAHLSSPHVDGVLTENNTILVLNNDSKIKSDDILQKRKRMSTPYTTPMSFGVLEKMAG
jgi:hypothetical protein